MADQIKRSLVKSVARLPGRFRVDRPKRFRIRDADPDDTAGLSTEDVGDEVLAASVERLTELQEKLYAEDRRAVLLVFQAMDAAGKDSTIEHVMSGVNPAGCQVVSFKAPTHEELDHDYLWRHARHLPERGRIGIFNRSWYEEVLIVRVHEEILRAQRMPEELVTKHVWDERFEDINGFERYLARNGVLVLKFFLHVSKEEQRRRFLARIENPSKNWKFQLGDVEEREHWDDYMAAYEDMIRSTSTKHARWHVVPADNKWFTRLAVASIVVDAIETLDPKVPKSRRAKTKELRAARRRLQREGR
jgi:PPK2 family polyphosphate:nucleotide phosphotransferase